MLFAILGPVEVTARGQPVRIGGARARAVLAMLVLRAGRVTPADAIAEALWPELDHARATANLQVRVSQLRAAFRAAGEPDRLVTAAPGYLLNASAAEVDALRFAGLVDEGRVLLRHDDPAGARTRLAEALGLWRGEPLADLADAAWARGEVARLAQLRLDALELHADARLADGETGGLVAELEALTQAHPLRERLWAQRMLALYRSGRQAEALAVYRQARAHLVGELGIEPGAELRDLEARILAQDPGLASQAGRVPGPDVPGVGTHGNVPPGESGEAAPAPGTARDLATECEQRDLSWQPTGVAGVIPAPVGRETELAEIGEFLGGLQAGPRALVITGEAGIGKTTLWNAGNRLAAGHGFAVMPCRPVESEAQLAFSALADLLADVPEAAFAELPVPQRRALDAAMLRADPAGQPPDRRAVAVAALGVLRVLCRSRPLLLAVDDLAFTDTSSFLVLVYALRRLGRERAGLLATARPGDVEDLELATSLGPGALRRLEVGPLGLSAFRAALNSRHTEPLGRTLAARLHDASGGNPFVGLELAAALDARGDTAEPGEPLPVSASLRALARGRLDALPEHGRQTALHVAAVPNPTVASIVAAGGDRARAGLDVAEAAGVIQVTGQRIRFSHPVLRSVAYSQATAGERREAHRVLAGVTPEPEERARHLALAAEGPDQAVAAALDAAASSAYLRGAPGAAAELASLAVTMTPGGNDADRVRRLTRAGELFDAAGDYESAQVVIERAIAASAPGASRARTLYLQAKVARNVRNGPSAAALLHRGLAEAAADDLRLRAAMHRDLGFVLANLGDPAGREHYRQALELAARAGDPGLQAQARVLCEFADVADGRPLRREALSRWLDDAQQAGAPAEHQAMELRPKVVASHLLRYAGDLAAARLLLMDEYKAVIEQGADSDLPLLALWLVELETWAGNWSLAERYAEQGYRAAMSSAGPLAATCGMRSILRACRGQLIDARRDADTAIERARSFGWALPAMWGAHAHALASLSLGDAAAAHAALEAISSPTLAQAASSPAYSRVVPEDAEALVRLGKVDQAERLITTFDRASRRAQNGPAIAAAARCRALLAGALGDSDAAAAALAEAFAAHARLEMPFDLARTHLAAAETHRQARHGQAAARNARTALVLFQQLGAVVWAARAREELARA